MSTAAISLQILVIDTCETSRRAACAQVLALGHNAVPMPDRSTAADWLCSNAADVILLDWDPSFSVTGSAQVGMSIPPSDLWLPVILVSDPLDAARPRRPLPEGADDWLDRPLDSALLAARLQRCGQLLAQQRRQRSRIQQMRDIQDNILDAVLTVDDTGEVVEANLAACRTFCKGEPASLTGADVQAVTGHDLTTLARSQRLRLACGNGSSFVAQVSVSSWEEAGAQRVTLVIKDLTDILRNERMRDEFLATVSHELRTPLTSVLGAVSLLVSGAAGPLPAQAMPLAAAAQRNGERLSKLIDDVLDLTKLEGDRMVLHVRSQPLGPLMQEAVKANQGYAAGLGVTIEADLSRGSDALALVDANRLLQVMANLLSNAIKHSPAGETVTLRLESAEGGHAIVVSDAGPGVPEAYRSFLFEKFSQADASDGRVVGGTGLGLHIARLLVERMAGRIKLVADARQGATFRVWLPQVLTASACAGAGAQAAAIREDLIT